MLKSQPKEIGDFFYYIKQLQFNEKPDYAMLKKIFKNGRERMKFTLNHEWEWAKDEEKRL